MITQETSSMTELEKMAVRNTNAQSLLLLMHPIGSLYMSMVSTDPSTLFGGTWSRIEDTFILAVGDNHPFGTSGGEETHILTIPEIPSHNHESLNAPGYESGDEWVGAAGTSTANTRNTSSTGGNQPHNNMPPYITAYVWQRTA